MPLWAGNENKCCRGTIGVVDSRETIRSQLKYEYTTSFICACKPEPTNGQMETYGKHARAPKLAYLSVLSLKAIWDILERVSSFLWRAVKMTESAVLWSALNHNEPLPVLKSTSSCSFILVKNVSPKSKSKAARNFHFWAKIQNSPICKKNFKLFFGWACCGKPRPTSYLLLAI